MRRVLLASSALIGFISLNVAVLSGQTPTEKSSVASPNVQPICPPGGCLGGGGGHGGGGGGSTAGGALSFAATSIGGTVIGGVPGREGPGVTQAIGNNAIAYVYANPYDSFGDNYGDEYIWYGTTQQLPARISSTCCITSTANPALQEVLIGGTGYLFLATVSQQANVGNGNYGGISTLSRYNNSTWTTLGQISTQSTMYSPSFAASSQYLFTGLVNAADNTLTVCRTDITVLNGATSCTQHPGSTNSLMLARNA